MVGRPDISGCAPPNRPRASQPASASAGDFPTTHRSAEPVEVPASHIGITGLSKNTQEAFAENLKLNTSVRPICVSPSRTLSGFASSTNIFIGKCGYYRTIFRYRRYFAPPSSPRGRGQGEGAYRRICGLIAHPASAYLRGRNARRLRRPKRLAHPQALPQATSRSRIPHRNYWIVKEHSGGHLLKTENLKLNTSVRLVCPPVTASGIRWALIYSALATTRLTVDCQRGNP